MPTHKRYTKQNNNNRQKDCVMADLVIDSILAFASLRKDIQLVTLEGSRANVNAKKDRFQDYDISFFMEDISSLRQDTSWLEHFGKILMMQMPESMELFPPDLKDGWESYLVLYENGIKIDFTLIPLSDVEYYFTHEKLTQVLLDKNDIVSKTMGREIVPSDEDFWLKPLTQRSFDDCLNEFYHLKGYALRAYLRDEAMSMNAYIDSMREALLILLCWERALEALRGGDSKRALLAPTKPSKDKDLDCDERVQELKIHTKRFHYNFSFGKHCKYLPDFLSKGTYKTLLKTYKLGDITQSYKALKALQRLCDETASKIAKHTGFVIPNYKKAIHTYYKALKKL